VCRRRLEPRSRGPSQVQHGAEGALHREATALDDVGMDLRRAHVRVPKLLLNHRLRIDEIRVFYDITGTTVEILAIVPKPEAEQWLAQFGNLE